MIKQRVTDGRNLYKYQKIINIFEISKCYSDKRSYKWRDISTKQTPNRHTCYENKKMISNETTLYNRPMT